MVAVELPQATQSNAGVPGVNTVESKHAEPPAGSRPAVGSVRSADTPNWEAAAAVAARIVRWDSPLGGFDVNVAMLVSVPAALKRWTEAAEGDRVLAGGGQLELDVLRRRVGTRAREDLADLE